MEKYSCLVMKLYTFTKLIKLIYYLLYLGINTYLFTFIIILARYILHKQGQSSSQNKAQQYSIKYILYRRHNNIFRIEYRHWSFFYRGCGEVSKMRTGTWLYHMCECFMNNHSQVLSR